MPEDPLTPAAAAPDAPIGGRELAEARQAVTATRSVLKSQMRSLRTALSFIADLDERLARVESALAQPKEAQRNDSREDT